MALLALLVVVGLGSRQLPSGAVTAPPSSLAVDVDVTRALGIVIAVAAVVAALFLVWLFWPSDAEWQEPERPRSLLAILGAIIGVSLLISALMGRETILRGVDLDANVSRSAQQESSESAPTGSGVALLVLGVAVAAIVTALAVATRATRRSATSDAVAPEEIAAPETDQPLPEPAFADDPWGRVLQAYAGLRQAAATVAPPARAAEAPREYLLRVRSHLGAGADAARDLTVLYEVARFSTRPITDDEGARAVGALAVVRQAMDETLR